MKIHLIKIFTVLTVLSLIFVVACDRIDDPVDTIPSDMPTQTPGETTDETPAMTTPPAATDPAATDPVATDPASTDGVTTPTPDGGELLLSAADARAMVLEDFGSPSIIQKIEYNYDDDNPLYKGEGRRDGSKVVFELSAVSGEFEKWDIDDNNGWDDFQHALDSMITMEEAAESVIERSGVDETFVQKIEFDWDEDEPEYKGEAFSEGFKYQFEIDAYTGDFDEWDVDDDDDTWAEQYHNVR